MGAGHASAEPAKTPPPPANVSLGDAVRTAEQHSPGKAIRAEYERRKDGKWVYEIKLANGQTLTEVKVDANDGTVVNTSDANQRDGRKDDDNDDDKD